MNGNVITLTIILDESEEDEHRDLMALNLLRELKYHSEIFNSELSTMTNSAIAARSGEFIEIGKLLLQIPYANIAEAAVLLIDSINSNRNIAQVKLQVGDTSAEFPSNTSPQQLESWINALKN